MLHTCTVYIHIVYVYTVDPHLHSKALLQETLVIGGKYWLHGVMAIK